MIYAFEDYVLDTDRRELWRGADIVAVEPQVFDLLLFLIRNRTRVVTKDDLIAGVWNGRIVSDSTLSSRITAARQAIGDSGEEQRLVRTVTRKGLRFVGDVREERASSEPKARAVEGAGRQKIDGIGAEPSALAIPDKPSIAVLPFENLSDDAKQDYFAEGIVEDIITELSRFRELFVIARNSSFQYKGKAVDVRRVGRDLGVRYVLEGSIRRGGDRVRIAAQLVDAESGGHIWAERYDRDYGDVFALQDEVTQSVVTAIQPEILIGEGRRVARKCPTNLNAFDSFMRGMWHVHQSTPHDNRQAESWFDRSIKLDPTLARAHMMLSRVLTSRCWRGHSDDIDRDLRASQAAANLAVRLDDRDAGSHYALALISLSNRQHERALAAAQRAIDLNPNFALGHFALGETRLFMGQFPCALDSLKRCLRLSPYDPSAFLWLSLTALAQYHLGNYKEALHHSEQALKKRHNYVVLRTMAATLGQLGRVEEARPLLIEMEPIKPTGRQWVITSPYADPAHEAQLLDGLRKARLLEN